MRGSGLGAAVDIDMGAAEDTASPADGVLGPDDDAAGAHAASAATVSERGSSGTVLACGHERRARACWHRDAILNSSDRTWRANGLAMRGAREDRAHRWRRDPTDMLQHMAAPTRVVNHASRAAPPRCRFSAAPNDYPCSRLSHTIRTTGAQ
jgi:hypothetical protein